MTIVRLTTAVLAVAILALPAAAEPLVGGECDLTTAADPLPSASPDSQVLVMSATWIEPGARDMVITCSVRVGSDGERVVLRSIGTDGVAVIPPTVTTIEMPELVPVYYCTHRTWSDSAGSHDEEPDCLVISSGTSR